MVPAVTDTATSATPGMRRTAVLILLAHPAQSIPPTRKRACVEASAIIMSLHPLMETLHPLVTRGASTMMQGVPIGEAAGQSGVKVPTIRYYEQIGLLPAPLRSEGNRRYYDEADLRRLVFIRHAR